VDLLGHRPAYHHEPLRLVRGDGGKVVIEMSVIIRTLESGMPWGVYNISYFTLRGGELHAEPGEDVDVSEAYAKSQARKLSPRQALCANCRSRPGAGMWAFGSAAAEAAFKRASTG
jgi:hypothetical protein